MAKSESNGIGGLRERLSFGEQSVAMDVRGKVAVTEIEPIGTAIRGQPLQRVKRFAAKSPAF